MAVDISENSDLFGEGFKDSFFYDIVLIVFWQQVDACNIGENVHVALIDTHQSVIHDTSAILGAKFL